MATYHNQLGTDIQTLGNDGGQFQGMLYTSNIAGIIRVGSRLYFPAFNLDSESLTAFVSMSVSYDYGKSWIVADAANQPILDFFNGADQVGTLANDGKTIVMLYSPINGGDIRLRNFDTVSNTWGGDYGIGPAYTGPLSLFPKSDGKFTALMLSADAGTPLVVLDYDPDSDTWGAATNVCAHMQALPGYDSSVTFVNNNWTTAFLNDEIYLFFHMDSGIGDTAWQYRCFFQLIQADHSIPLVNFYDFPGNAADPPDIQFGNIKIGVPCFVRTGLYVPISRTDLVNFPGGGVRRASSYWGVIVSGVSQVWTELTANNGNTDPGYGPAPDYATSFDWLHLSDTMGMTFYDGTTLYYLYSGEGSLNKGLLGNDELRYLTCIPFSDDPNDWIWTGVTAQSIFDTPFTDLPNYANGANFFWPYLFVNGPYVMLASSVSIGGDTYSFWYGNFGPTPPVIFSPVPPAISLPFECCMDFHLGCQLKV